MTAWNTHRNRLAVALTLLGVIAFTSPQAGLAQRDPISCGFFDTQEDAQAALDENPDLALTLDSDGNDIACEGVFDEDEDDGEVDDEDEVVAALPSTGTGTTTAQDGLGALGAELLAFAAVAGLLGLRTWTGQSPAQR